MPINQPTRTLLLAVIEKAAAERGTSRPAAATSAKTVSKKQTGKLKKQHV